VTSTIRGSQLVRLLGAWQPDAAASAFRRATPDYIALAESLRGLLTDGRLALGVRLPAERELAETLEISRTTVTAAYNELRSSGHLKSRRGAGSWTTLPGGARVDSSGLWAADGGAPDLIDLATAALSAPPQMAEAAREAVAALPAYLSGTGYHPAGIPELRSIVAGGFTERGLPTTADQIMITSGVQHALDLAVRLLVPPGSAVLTESPTYPNALAAFNARRARVHTYGLDRGGWDDELLLATIRQTGARIAYLIPEFHNPTGWLMHAGLRAKLPSVAHSAGTDLIVDESFVDLLLDERVDVPPPVATYDRHARVLCIGGMSKPYWGGLRIGWIRATEQVVQRLAAVRVGVDMAGPVLDQLVGVALLQRRRQIVAARRAQLREQRDILVAALGDATPSWQFMVPSGGLSLWVELDAPISTALARAAEAFGVRVAPGPRFGVDGTLERFLRLPFTLPPADLNEAVRRLVDARADVSRGTRRAWDAPALVA
jgi:DNA-binding transcriptional MocR family regulator